MQRVRMRGERDLGSSGSGGDFKDGRIRFLAFSAAGAGIAARPADDGAEVECWEEIAGTMTRKPRGRPDPIEQEIEFALQPGAYIADRAGFSFVADLAKVAAKIASLTATDASRAAALYEIFLAACCLKIEELDDSSGYLGEFVDDLVCGWIQARQADGANPNDTASRLLTWMDHDEFGLFFQVEKRAARVLDRGNLAALVTQIRARFDAAAQAGPMAGGSRGNRPDYLRRRWGEALRTLYSARKDVAAYVALAEESGLTARDCHVVATLLASRRKPDEALAWVERGLALGAKAEHGSMDGDDLARLKRELLCKLGRADEALAAAWAEYCGHPSTHTYADLMRFVPKAERAGWHEKAIEAAVGDDLHSTLELLVATREIGRVADLVRRISDRALEGLSHYTTEPAAKKLERPYPDLAARLWRAQGLRIVNAKKSKYYDAALSNFACAKRCFERAGLDAEWQETVRKTRADHQRKSGFMPGFERLVAGSVPGDEPTFLQRAKARWHQRQGRAE